MESIRCQVGIYSVIYIYTDIHHVHQTETDVYVAKQRVGTQQTPRRQYNHILAITDAISLRQFIALPDGLNKNHLMCIHKEDIVLVSLVGIGHLVFQDRLHVVTHTRQFSLVLRVQPVIPHSHHHDYKAQRR